MVFMACMSWDILPPMHAPRPRYCRRGACLHLPVGIDRRRGRWRRWPVIAAPYRRRRPAPYARRRPAPAPAFVTRAVMVTRRHRLRHGKRGGQPHHDRQRAKYRSFHPAFSTNGSAGWHITGPLRQEWGKIAATWRSPPGMAGTAWRRAHPSAGHDPLQYQQDHKRHGNRNQALYDLLFHPVAYSVEPWWRAWWRGGGHMATARPSWPLPPAPGAAIPAARWSAAPAVIPAAIIPVAMVAVVVPAPPAIASRQRQQAQHECHGPHDRARGRAVRVAGLRFAMRHGPGLHAGGMAVPVPRRWLRGGGKEVECRHGDLSPMVRHGPSRSTGSNGWWITGLPVSRVIPYPCFPACAVNKEPCRHASGIWRIFARWPAG